MQDIKNFEKKIKSIYNKRDNIVNRILYLKVKT